jgi:hypothetical protein
VRNRFRNYEIVSMDIETYNLSRTFLFRHHTLRKIRDILNLKIVLASTCTPSWFLNQYILYSAYPSHCRWQRINSLDNIESSDEDTSMAAKHTSATHPSSQTHRPRHLRTVHKNEVWSIFASHSKWIVSLIEKHKDLKGKVNTQSWINFLSQIPQLRQMAELDEDTCGKWGLVDEQGGNKMGKIPTSLSIPKAVMPQSTTPKKQKHKKCISTKV